MAPRDPISAILGPGGLFARAAEGYEHRPQQIEMARLVRRVLAERRFALIEAGTGTGKTLAYLIPAILSGRRVVISTATKTLQEQIVGKDLPRLREVVDLDFRATVMKGRSNYLCLWRLERADDDPRFTLASRHEARAFQLIRDWSRETETGDKAELDLPENVLVWRALSATSETCAGQRCPRHAQCFVTRMRQQAVDSDLLIVNHHLLFADLALKTTRANAGAEVIPRYEAVVFDEAHAVEDVATEYFGCGASDYRLEDLLHDARSALAGDKEQLGAGPLMLKIEAVSENLFHTVNRMLPRGSDQPRRFTRADAPALQEATGELCDVLMAFASRIARSEDPDVQGIGRRAKEISGDLEFLSGMENPTFVYWAEARARATFLRAAPIDVANELRERLYQVANTVVFTSATLAAQGRLDFAKRRLGLADPETGEDLYAVEALVVSSPFDFLTQAALYAPTALPEPADPRFVEQVAEEIYALCELTGGRAFALFTSLRNMTEAHRLLKDRLPYRVLLQGERPKQALLAEFKERPAVLFAAHSFWEGVDVVGDALSLVIIDKLPFASPADPVVAARVELLKARGHDAFGEYQVPQAALALRQGFGRLIRSRRDRGIVAVLDRRLTTKSYGRAFLASLPRCPRTADRRVIAQWWERGRAASCEPG